MKKIILLSALFLVHSIVFAQTNTEGESSDSTGTVTKNQITPATAQSTQIDYQALSDFLTAWKAGQNDTISVQEPQLVPITGKSRFMKRHYLTQRLEISMMGGNDKDSQTDDTFSDELRDTPSDDNPINFGLNIGYSLVFCPGHIEGDQLRLNRLGFAYSVGAIAQFDRQDRYGTTCDLMAKIGIETGFSHKMGVGIDLLVGTGKTSGELSLYDPTALYGDAELPENLETNTPYTDWCFKYGMQIWVRSGLLHTMLKGTDVRLFARYVRSVDPNKGTDFSNMGMMSVWNEESWQFGVTFYYQF